MVLHYEDTNGNLKEFEFVYRLPTGMAREQLRVAIAEAVKRGKDFDKKNPNHVLNERLVAAFAEFKREDLTTEEKTKATAEYQKIVEEVSNYNVALNGLKQENSRIFLKIIASNETKALLTDTMLQSLSIEEVDEAVTQFRERIKI